MLKYKLLSIAFISVGFAFANKSHDKPNILLIVAEDHGPHMGCYGDTFATTPNVDKLAEKGMCYNYAWSNAPVCAPARTTLWTGIMAPSTGAENMRSMVSFPEGKTMFPEFLREAGYYCAGNGKEDYNLPKPNKMWDESSIKAHWKKRPSEKPFFAYFNNTESHEGKIHEITRNLKTGRIHSPHDPAKVRIPAYQPDVQEVRDEWAAYYNSVTKVDSMAGIHLAELARAGLQENTIVFYFADHGAGLARNKRWPNNAGLQVPVVVYFPEKWKHLAPKEYKTGGRSDRLISFVDFAPTILSIAGIKAPEWMQGHAFAGEFQADEQAYVYGFRGRMDERTDLVRSVSNGRYVYLRNYMPHFSQGQRIESQIRFPFSSTAAWKKLYDEGKLNEAQRLFWNAPKAPEELYDLKNDPDEVKNLADSPKHKAILKELREAQQNYARFIRDVGFIPEGERFNLSKSPYDFGHDADLYPFDRVFSTAELASFMKSEDVPELQKRLKDENNIVRYWAAMGMLMHGEDAVKKAQKELTTALSDSSIDVRIAAAWAMSKYGDETMTRQGLSVLAELAPGETNNMFTSMAALTALDDCEMKAISLKNEFPQWSVYPISPDKRYSSYCWKLMKSIKIRFGYEVPLQRKN